jgi:EAL domain-containing protein (putative c-di-GMP-specific phosphodiesterase class I)
MQQLTRIAFTQLKIDQSFVINAAKQDTARIILGASLEMAKKLKITAVAEGVETRDSWELLRDLKCDLAQGYLFAKPMEARLYLDWTRDWGKMR